MFELIVIFFKLMNSLAIFQTIMNKLLRDLINTGKMGSFINNIIVGTESEKGYNELVEEILRRLEENNLYKDGERKDKGSIRLASS